MVESTSLKELSDTQARHLEDINTISQSWPDTARILSELKVAMDSFAQKQDGMTLLFSHLIKENLRYNEDADHGESAVLILCREQKENEDDIDLCDMGGAPNTDTSVRIDGNVVGLPDPARIISDNLAEDPEIKFALNEDLFSGQNGAPSYGYGGSSRAGPVIVDECNFHESVNLESFDIDRTLSLVPSDGEFPVMNYRITQEVLEEGSTIAEMKRGLEISNVLSKANRVMDKLADESVCIGEAPSSQSYLVIPNVLSAAMSRGCTMLHPGYGFLSENAVFVKMCREHGINFIGPNPDNIRVMGDKSTARETMKNAGVPTVPGSDGLLKSTDEGVKLANEIGYPVMIKATAGGGGRGMCLAKELDEFAKLLQQAKSEAGAAFGNDGVYLEKYVQNPRHIEFQVLADKFGNVVHFGERDCSIQRRNQKLLEEAPSPALTSELRKAMGDAAVAAATSIGYVGVGTVEFLLDERGSFYFMEMNTRIQVEHPVTEMISSVDLIEEHQHVVTDICFRVWDPGGTPIISSSTSLTLGRLI